MPPQAMCATAIAAAVSVRKLRIACVDISAKKADCWAGRLGIQRATESTAAIEQTTFGLLDSLDVGQNPGTIEVGFSRTVESEV